MPFFGRKPWIYQPHHYLLYELTPDFRSEDGLSRHNARGFRGGEFDCPKPEGVYRVVCMGDSATYCEGIRRDDETYPGRIQHHLRLIWPGRRLEVINAGVGGYSSAECLLQYIFKIEAIEPDLIVYHYTHNDVHARRFPTMSRDYREYSRSWYEWPVFEDWRQTWLYRLNWLFRPERLTILDRIRRYSESSDRARANVFCTSSAPFEANLRSLITLVQAARTDLLLVSPPYIELDKVHLGKEHVHPGAWAMHEYRQIVAKLAVEKGCGLLDLAGAIEYLTGDGPPWKSPLFLDKVHVNEKGADVMGERIARAIAGSFDPGSRPR